MARNHPHARPGHSVSALDACQSQAKGRADQHGTLHARCNGNVLTVAAPPQNVGEMAALAVTDEPNGGSPQPTSKPMWVGPLE